MDPSELYLDPQLEFIAKDARTLSTYGWKYLLDLQKGLTSIDLSSQVTGVLDGINGGTGVANTGKTITIGGNVSTVGNFALSLILAGATSIHLPTTGSLMWSQAARASTGSIGAGLSAVVTVTWPVTFGNVNYTPVVSVLDTTASIAALSIVHIESQTATEITVRVLNSAAGALTGTVNAIGLHD